MYVSKICFLNRENSDVLLVCCAGPGYSCVEVWHLLEQTMPLHRMFQSAANPELACKTPKWMHKNSIQHNAHLTDIARPKLPMNRTYNIEASAFLSYFACTYKDGVIKIIHRQSYQVCAHNLVFWCVHVYININSQKVTLPYPTWRVFKWKRIASKIGTQTFMPLLACLLLCLIVGGKVFYS